MSENDRLNMSVRQESKTPNKWKNELIKEYRKVMRDRQLKGKTVENIAAEERLIQLYVSLEIEAFKQGKTIKSSRNFCWAYRGVAKPLGYLLSSDEREEWIGDLLEIQERMILEDRYSIHVINIVISVKAALLVWVKV